MNIERLEKIATHLETGKLGHKVFDFTQVNSNCDTGKCGSNGCAIGEFPFIFKKDWQFYLGGVVPLNRKKEWQGETISETIREYLDLTRLKARFLFFPYPHPGCWKSRRTYELLLLHGDSTRYQVAARIRRFIDYQLHRTLDAREAQAKKDRDFGIAQRAMRMRMIRAHELLEEQYEKVC